MSEVNPQATPAPTDSTEQTPPQGAPPALNEEQVKNHPLFKELEGKHAAAEREANRYKGRLDKASKGLQDEDQTADKNNQPAQPAYVTKEELDAKAWELANAKDVEVYGDDEYKQDIGAGIPRDKALKYAKLRFQANPDKARQQRQESIGSPGAGSVRNLDSVEITEKDRQDMKIWGYSEETLKKHKQMKKEREQS